MNALQGTARKSKEAIRRCARGEATEKRQESKGQSAPRGLHDATALTKSDAHRVRRFAIASQSHFITIV